MYRINDPFLRLWFRLVAPHRAALVAGTNASRALVLDRGFDQLVAEAWEELCRRQVPELERQGPWGPARRWWHKTDPEWDIVSTSLEGNRILLGEARFSRTPFDLRRVKREIAELKARPMPAQISHSAASIVHALFVPALAKGVPRQVAGAEIVTLGDLLARI